MAENDLEVLLQEAVKDKNFLDALEQAETAEEAQNVFASRKIDLSIDDVKAIAAGMRKSGEELGDDDLDAVSGGSVLTKAASLALKVLSSVNRQILGGPINPFNSKNSIFSKWRW